MSSVAPCFDCKGCSLPGVRLVLHGAYWLSSLGGLTKVVTHTPGCQIGYMGSILALSSIGCVLTHNNNVVKSANPDCLRG
jgi:hypothetical protein